jgi:aspartate/tyrosine/aromatic aminotransferase
MSFFQSVLELPADPIFNLHQLFAEDTRAEKVNLGIGSYKDANGSSFILPAVREAEAELVSLKVDKEYLPIAGYAPFIKNSESLIFADSLTSYLGEIFSAQTPGGTGALKIGADFLNANVAKSIFLSDLTWPNHPMIFKRAGMQVQTYRYFDYKQNALDFAGMCNDIRKMPPQSVILFQVKCHNPTGVDPTFEQWKEISSLIKQHQLLPFFDFAYQGFGESLEEDAEVIRFFASQGHEMLMAYSFSKNFGLYNDRVGLLSVLSTQKNALKNVVSQVKQIIRNTYSNPPAHGAFIVNQILQSETLKKEWSDALADMRLRIHEMRRAFVDELQVKARDVDWNFLRKQTGFFSFCGFSSQHVEQLIQKHAVYLPQDGRINVAGLNDYNREYVVKSIIDTLYS